MNNRDTFYQPDNVTVSYDASGQQVMTAAQRKEYIKKLKSQRREFTEKRLRENFPLFTVYVIVIAHALIGLASIVIQIVLMVNYTPKSGTASGIINGIFCIACAVFTFLLVLKRKVLVYFVSFMTNLLQIVIGITVQGLLNIQAYLTYDNCEQDECKNYDNLKALNMVLIILAGVSSLVSIIFILAISASTNAWSGKNFSNQPLPKYDNYINES